MSVQLSIYAKFGSKSERDKWFSENIAYQIYPSKGPVFAWSDENESGYRDLITELVEALENELDDLNTDIRWADGSQLEGLIERRTKLEAAITKAKDQTNEHKT